AGGTAGQAGARAARGVKRAAVQVAPGVRASPGIEFRLRARSCAPLACRTGTRRRTAGRSIHAGAGRAGPGGGAGHGPRTGTAGGASPYAYTDAYFCVSAHA